MINLLGIQGQGKNYYTYNILGQNPLAASRTKTQVQNLQSTNQSFSFVRPFIYRSPWQSIISFFSNFSKRPEERAKEYAFDLTSNFESSGYDSIQTKDDGIISYGLHQATLRSGTLEKIISQYRSVSNSDVSQGLSAYAGQIAEKDPGLRHDDNFLSLLSAAAADKQMQLAQNEVFSKLYWTPAYKKALSLNLNSKLAAAIFYDTNVQGGLNNVIKRTANRLLDQQYTEKDYLITFLSERRKYLLEVAKHKDPIQARMLENSAYNRVGYLIKLVDNNILLK